MPCDRPVAKTLAANNLPLQKPLMHVSMPHVAYSFPFSKLQARYSH